jgi:hypothetical protein
LSVKQIPSAFQETLNDSGRRSCALEECGREQLIASMHGCRNASQRLYGGPTGKRFLTQLDVVSQSGEAMKELQSDGRRERRRNVRAEILGHKQQETRLQQWAQQVGRFSPLGLESNVIAQQMMDLIVPMESMRQPHTQIIAIRVEE